MDPEIEVVVVLVKPSNVASTLQLWKVSGSSELITAEFCSPGTVLSRETELPSRGVQVTTKEEKLKQGWLGGFQVTRMVNESTAASPLTPSRRGKKSVK